MVRGMRGLPGLAAVAASTLIVLLSVPRTAEANCATGRTFSTKNPALYSGENRIATPGGPFATRSVSDAALGYFWSLGYGSPTTYAQPAAPWDNDCGKQADGLFGSPAGRCGSPLGNADWWIVNPTDGDYRSYIGGNFSHWNAGTKADGCVDWDGSDFTNHRSCDPCLDQHQCMVTLLVDDPAGDEGYFLVLADEADEVGHYALNEAFNGTGQSNPGLGETLSLAPVPKAANVVRTVIAPTHVRFELEVAEPPLGAAGGRWESCPASTVAGGCVPPPACPNETPCHQTVCGFRVYTQVREASDPPPDSRNVKSQEGWVRRSLSFDAPSNPACTSAGTDVAPFAGRATLEEAACAPGRTVHICTTLVLDSGFETPYCSGDVTLSCGPDCVDDADCNDGKFCNGTETCDAGDCQPGSGPCDYVCDEDGDTCNGPVSCSGPGECDDGKFCNGAETCEGGFCRSGAPVACPGDGIDCTIEACDEDTDSCVSAPDDGRCDDGLFCSGVETCDPFAGCQVAEACPTSGPPACDENEDQCVAHGAEGGAVPDGSVIPGQPLTIAKSGATLTLAWGPSCNTGDSTYAVYEGRIGSFYSHRQIGSCTNGANPLGEEITPSESSSYYLVVPRTATREGSYGTDSSGAERPAGYVVCQPKEVQACE